jgi:hypothetical protein
LKILLIVILISAFIGIGKKLTNSVSLQMPSKTTTPYDEKYASQASIKDYVWWDIMASQGNALAAENRDKIAKKMTPQQIDEAQKLAKECQERNYKNCD